MRDAEHGRARRARRRAGPAAWHGAGPRCRASGAVVAGVGCRGGCVAPGTSRRQSRRPRPTKTAAVAQPSSASKPARATRELAGEQPERRQSEQRDDREGEAAAERGSSGEETAQLGDAAGAFDEWQFTRRRGTRPILPSACAMTCRSSAAIGEAGADRRRRTRRRPCARCSSRRGAVWRRVGRS